MPVVVRLEPFDAFRYIFRLCIKGGGRSENRFIVNFTDRLSIRKLSAANNHGCKNRLHFPRRQERERWGYFKPNVPTSEASIANNIVSNIPGGLENAILGVSTNLVKVYHFILVVDCEGRPLILSQTNLVYILTGGLTFESLVVRTLPELGRRFARVQSLLMNSILKGIEFALFRIVEGSMSGLAWALI